MRLIKMLISLFIKKGRDLKRQNNFKRQHDEFNAYCVSQYLKRV